MFAAPTPAPYEMVWVLLGGYRYIPAQVAHALRTLLQVRNVVCHIPAVMAGLALLEAGGDFAVRVIAFEGTLLGGTEFVPFDQHAVKLLQGQKREVWLLGDCQWAALAGKQAFPRHFPRPGRTLCKTTD